MSQKFTTECEKAVSALRVYKQRGQKALECLLAGRLELALRVLRKRNAAFHNFNCYAANVTEEELRSNEEYENLVHSLGSIDSSLDKTLTGARDQVFNELKSCTENRNTIKKFRYRYEPRPGVSIGV